MSLVPLGTGVKQKALLYKIREPGTTAEEIIFTSAMSARETGDLCEEALFLSMCVFGTTADVTSFNSTKSACERGGQWKQTLVRLHNMRETRCRLARREGCGSSHWCCFKRCA